MVRVPRPPLTGDDAMRPSSFETVKQCSQTLNVVRGSAQETFPQFAHNSVIFPTKKPTLCRLFVFLEGSVQIPETLVALVGWRRRGVGVCRRKVLCRLYCGQAHIFAYARSNFCRRQRVPRQLRCGDGLGAKSNKKCRSAAFIRKVVYKEAQRPFFIWLYSMYISSKSSSSSSSRLFSSWYGSYESSFSSSPDTSSAP